ncbi:gliding motility-associated peptidyl-prolyl isomerase GldI [Zeaxanthinibacter sp. PT1]|uniref:gliding motility-associated peptidyl-prolyl isomerase GldI n=1 Tax=Zeaxanthinibacter TaxID=561554 RepID=UPI00234992E8|nr:gliding motility-associated peptidyl-prolyl isomerase GldI [Zeaxanthinibacter sp. PT1]MDC6352163.1 gliding motility-associated peptidyl-prolyl isomerase GldI [Zeaxanthinibacter sp. PT1]
MRIYLLTGLAICMLMSCGEAEPRKPVKVKSGSFLKTSVERNKDLLSQEEARIRAIIADDSLNTYLSSASGSWYRYLVKNEQDDYLPKPDDLVYLTYDMMTLDNDTLYAHDEVGTVLYRVDRQELFPGLRHSVKLLKQGESAIFLYPSSQGYGYIGDKNKIGPNVPLKVQLTILDIEKQNDSI